jgi:hypothetical protein
MLNNRAFGLKDLGKVIWQYAGIRIIALEAITLIPPFLAELGHLAMLAEEGSWSKALEKLAFLDGFGDPLRDDWSIGDSLGQALAADVRNGSFLVEMEVGLLEDLLSV